jgi:hypothetical protein
MVRIIVLMKKLYSQKIIFLNEVSVFQEVYFIG